MKDKKSKIQLIIILAELIILVSLSSYRVYEYIIKDKEEIKENENGNENVKKYWVTFDYGNNSIRSIEVKENEKIELPDEPIKEGYKFGGWLNDYTLIDENYVVKEDITLKINWIDESINLGIKILVYQINIRKEANETSEDIGDVLLDETYEVLEILDSTNYTWYKIKQGNNVGYVANKKGESWIEYSDNSEETNNQKKTLYFYEVEHKRDNETTLRVEEKEIECSDNDKYQIYCTYYGKYECNSDNCSAITASIYGQSYNTDDKSIMIRDDVYKDYFIYNYKSNKIVSNIYNEIVVIDKALIAQKNDKVILLNWDGKEISKGYDDIFDYFSQKTGLKIPQNYSTAKKIVRYKENNKFGLLSLDSGEEITKALYAADELSIHNDNIVVKIDNLKYVMDEKGNIVSEGYENILWSNDKIIVILIDDTIDIIDYTGNSKIEDKINSNGAYYSRHNYYDAPINRFWINYEKNILTIEGIPRTKYIYNIESETLTIEEY